MAIRPVLRKFGKFTAWVLVVLLVLLGSVFGYVFTQKEHLQSLMLQALNQQLAAKVEVGGVELDLLGKFPDVSLRLDRVFCPDVLPKSSKDTLFYVEQVYVQFGVLDVLFGKTSVKRLSLENGRLEIRLYKNGTDNYHFWKEGTGPNPSVDLKRVVLNQIKVRIEARKANFETDFLAQNLTLNGTLRETGFDARLTWELLVPHWNRDALEIGGGMRISSKGDSYRLTDGLLTLGEWRLDLQGQAKGHHVTWQASSEKLEIKEALNLLPNNYLPDPSIVKADGLMKIKVRGHTTPLGTRIVADADVTNGEVLLSESAFEAQKISGHLHFDNGKRGRMEEAELHVSDLKATVRQGAFQGMLTMRNFNSPSLQTELTVRIPFDQAVHWFGYDDYITAAEGVVTGNIGIKKSFPSMADIQKEGLARAAITGKIQLSQGRAEVNGAGAPMEKMEAEAILSSPNADITRCTFRVGASDFSVQGMAHNVLDWGTGSPLLFELTADSRQLRLEDIFVWNIWNAHSTNDSAESVVWEYRVEAEVDKFTHGKFTATTVSGTFWSEQERIFGQGLRLRMAEGSATGDFRLDPAENKGSRLQLTTQLTGVRLKNVLADFENFGQKELTSNHLDGKMDAHVAVDAIFDEDWNVLAPSIKAIADIEIRNGRLSGYKPLQALSRFAEEKALQDVRFGLLKNTLTIENQQVRIPSMTIENSALSLWLQGTHSFENKVDYILKLQLNDLLGKNKKPRKNKELDAFIEVESSKGPLWIPMRIHGPMDDLKISLDKSFLKPGGQSTLEKDFKQQGKDLKNLFKPNVPASTQPTQSKYIFEWEEADPDSTKTPLHSLAPTSFP